MTNEELTTQEEMQEKEVVPRSLPEIALDELSAETKDFLLAHAAGGTSVPELIIGVLDRAAALAGFEPSKVA